MFVIKRNRANIHIIPSQELANPVLFPQITREFSLEPVDKSFCLRLLAFNHEMSVVGHKDKGKHVDARLVGLNGDIIHTDFKVL